MRFVVDECTGPSVANWLRGQGHEVVSAFDEHRGADDEEWIQRAFDEQRILITNDKDFGDKVYRDGHAHHGVILLRLADETPASKIAVLKRLLDQYGARISGQFVVATERRVRFGRRT